MTEGNIHSVADKISMYVSHDSSLYSLIIWLHLFKLYDIFRVRTHLESPWVWKSKFKVLKVSEKYIGSLKNLKIWWKRSKVLKSLTKKIIHVVKELKKTWTWTSPAGVSHKLEHLVSLSNDTFLVDGILEKLEFLSWNVLENSLNF